MFVSHFVQEAVNKIYFLLFYEWKNIMYADQKKYSIQLAKGLIYVNILLLYIANCINYDRIAGIIQI